MPFLQHFTVELFTSAHCARVQHGPFALMIACCMLNFNKESGTRTSLTLAQCGWGREKAWVCLWACHLCVIRLLTALFLHVTRVTFRALCCNVCVSTVVNCCGSSAWVEPQTLGTGAQQSRTAGNDWKCCNYCCPSACPGECAGQQPWELLELQLLELELLLLQFVFDSISRNKVPMR